MQYYTRQQLQGSLRYKESTLIGNWNEDRCMKDTVLKDFLAKADAGDLKIDQCAAAQLTIRVQAEGWSLSVCLQALGSNVVAPQLNSLQAAAHCMCPLCSTSMLLRAWRTFHR